MSALAAVIGVILCITAYGYNTAPDGTHNLGLLQTQMMLLHSGLALLIIAAVRAPREKAVAREERVRAQTDLSDEEREKVDANARKLLIVFGVILAVMIVGVLITSASQ